MGSTDPIAHGLMGFFRRGGMDSPRLKADSLRNVMRLTEDEPELAQLPVSALERYFVLTPAQEVRFDRMVAQRDYEEVRKVLTLSEERGIKKGLIRGQQNALLRILRRKFGDVPEEIEGIVRALPSPEAVQPYLDRILDAQRLEDMGFPANERQV